MDKIKAPKIGAFLLTVQVTEQVHIWILSFRHYKDNI